MLSYRWIKNIGLTLLVLIQGVMALLAFRQINYDQAAIDALTSDLTEQLEVLNRIERLTRQAYTLFLYDVFDSYVIPENIIQVAEEGQQMSRLLASRTNNSALAEKLEDTALGFGKLSAAARFYDQSERIFSSDSELWSTIISTNFDQLHSQIIAAQEMAGDKDPIFNGLTTLYLLAQACQDLFREKTQGGVHQPEIIVKLLGSLQGLWADFDPSDSEELLASEEYQANFTRLRGSVETIILNLPGIYQIWKVDPNLSYLQDEIAKIEGQWDTIQLALETLVREQTNQFQQKKEVFQNNSQHGKITFAVFAVSGLLSAMLLAAVLNRTLHRRLQNLVVAVRHYSQGDLDYRLNIAGRDEFAGLGSSFNAMAAHLEASKVELEKTVEHLTLSQARLQEAHSTLEVKVAERTRELQTANDKLLLMGKVFQNAREGILVADCDGRIIMANPEFLQMTGFSSAEILGRRPAFLRTPGEHDYFSELSESLLRNGGWVGELPLSHHNGQDIPTDMSVSPYHHEDQRLAGHIAIFHDLSKLKQQEALIRHRAYHDALTGLPNRLLLGDRLTMAIERARRRQRKIGIIFLDLDNFKKINDTMGHQFGDDLLIAVAKTLENSVRREDTISRIAGDEFIILLEDAPDILVIEDIAKKIHRRLSGYLEVRGRRTHVSASLGLAICPDHGETVDELIKNADLAMYSAKDQGKNAFFVFTREMALQSSEALELEEALRNAVAAEEFEVFYQPQVDLAGMRFVGAEALVRWRRPGHGLVSPAVFIPVCEESGLILSLGRFVLRAACRFAADFCQQPGCEKLRFSVNVSPRQFADPKLLDTIQEALSYSGLPAKNLEIEITETSMMLNMERTQRVLERLAELGVTIAIDDFGTGYSSLLQLKNFPIHTLKIDRTFVKDVPGDKSDEKLIETIIAMARHLGVTAVAEGVETETQCLFLKRLGCEKMQGFLISPPVPGSELKAIYDLLSGPGSTEAGEASPSPDVATVAG